MTVRYINRRQIGASSCKKIWRFSYGYLNENYANLCRIYTRTRVVIDRECACFVGISIISRAFRITVKKRLFVVSPSICPNVSMRLPLHEISWNFLSGTFPKILRSFKLIKMGGNNGRFIWSPKKVLLLPAPLIAIKALSFFLEWYEALRKADEV
jgi:hypothetical protein